MNHKIKSLTAIFILTLSLFTINFIAMANAESTVSFSDLNLASCQIQVYGVNGSLMGTYNSTDNDVIIPDNAIIVFKPAIATTNFMSPEGVFNFFVTYKDQIIGILIMLAIIGGIFALIVKVVT